MDIENKTIAIPDNIEQIDPLGEIRSYARKLWIEDGAKDNKNWKNYWKKAERMLVGGVSDFQSTKPENVCKTRDILSSDIRALIKQEDNELLSVLASAFKALLNDHECKCLANILMTHSFLLYDLNTVEPLDICEVSEVLSKLAWEYDQKFLEQRNCASAMNTSEEVRAEYWKQKLRVQITTDKPLTFADRNTIQRLINAVADEVKVLEITFKG